MNIPNHNFESLDTIFWVKLLKFFDADPDPGSGILLTLDPVSGINIPDPQHWYNTVNGLGFTGWWEKVCGGRSADNNRQPGIIIKLIYCKLGDLITCFLYFLLITGIILFKTLARKALQNRYPIIVRFFFMLHLYFYIHVCIVQCTLHYNHPVSAQKNVRITT